VVEGTFTLTHPDFQRLAGDRLVGENANPHFTFTLHVTRHGNTSGFDLAVGDPSGAKAFQSEGSEINPVTALRQTPVTEFLLLAVFSSFRL
jgi:hypothetical protein